MQYQELQEMYALQDKAAELNWQKSKMKASDRKRLEELEQRWNNEQAHNFELQHLAMFI